MSVSRDDQAASPVELTYEHYARYPDEGNRHEIIDEIRYPNPAPVPEYWIVDPDRKTLRKYSRADLADGQAEQCIDTVTFDGQPNVTVELTKMW